MKFITTKKHPELKAGVKFNESLSRKDMIVSNSQQTVYIPMFDIELLVEQGYIKEVEKPEFTPSDMMDFARWYTSHEPFDERGKVIIDIWIKTKDK